MADSLIDLLQARTVLVRTSKSIGTGALIAPQMILTCAHVVRHEADHLDAIEVLLPDPTEPGHFIWVEKAQNLHLSKKYEENTTAGTMLSTEFPDVAVIEINEAKTEYLNFPLEPTELSSGAVMQFLAFGFQKKERDLQRNVPQAVSLNYSGEQVDGIIRKLMFTNGLIRPGMSGAPLMDRETGSIVGIVHKTMSPNDDLGAYVIPLQTIWSVFEKWEEEGANQLYTLLTGSTHARAIKKQYRKVYPRFPLLKKYGARLFILPLFIFLLLWWMLYHLGNIGDSGMASLLLLVLSIGGTLIGGWLGEGVQQESSKVKAKLGKVIFGNIFLTGFGLVVLFLWSFFSSAWVYGNIGFDEEVPIAFVSGNAEVKQVEKKLTGTGVTRFMKFTVPFVQDSVILIPSGRAPKKFTLRSFSRKEFYFPKSFELKPVMILRFDPNYPFLEQMDKYRIEVTVERTIGGKKTFPYKFTHRPEKDDGALFIGRKLNAQERVPDWDKELRADPSIKRTEIVEAFIKIWKKAKFYPEVSLKRRDRISVKVVKNDNDSIYNAQSYSIKDDQLDRMLDIEIKQGL